MTRTRIVGLSSTLGALLVALYTVAAHQSRLRAAAAAGLLEVGVIMAAVRWTPAGTLPRSLLDEVIAKQAAQQLLRQNADVRIGTCTFDPVRQRSQRRRSSLDLVDLLVQPRPEFFLRFRARGEIARLDRRKSAPTK